MKYRAEIDGLRALAVVPVILFHAGFELFSGGFVGVDVFFVISGYLITTILIEDIENDRFSIVSFYERRARRILPALFFVMFVCIPFAWMWMVPSQMKNFSQSLVAVSLFASNVLFWKESGYFDAAAEEKPLLHTWSLAVEEQYYLLFPIFLILAWRFGKNRVFWMIVVFSAISLVLSEWGWRKQETANFYLAPTRAWELLSGSIAAFIAHKRGVKANNPLSMLGIAAIIFSIFFFDETTPFPSVYALVPVLGVVLLVLYADETTYAAKLLGTKVFVGIGLVSYSAYLWHQPLFAFARIRLLEVPSGLVMGILCITSIALAYGSWKFVEFPFRRSERISRRQIFSTSSLGLSLLMSIGLVGHLLNGQTGRFEQEVIADWRDDSSCVVNDGFLRATQVTEIEASCFDESNNFVLIGDSHAQAISASIRSSIESRGGQLVTLLKNGCLLIPGTSRNPFQEECVRDKNQYWDFIESVNATIVFSTRWRLNLVGSRFDNGEGGIEYGSSGINHVLADHKLDTFEHVFQTISQLSKTHNVVVLSQVPEAGWVVPERVAQIRVFSPNNLAELTTSYEVYKEKNRKVIGLMTRLAALDQVSVLDLEQLVCNNQITERCLNSINGMSLYRDDNHPSPLYSQRIAELFVSEVLK